MRRRRSRAISCPLCHKESTQVVVFSAATDTPFRVLHNVSQNQQKHTPLAKVFEPNIADSPVQIEDTTFAKLAALLLPNTLLLETLKETFKPATDGCVFWFLIAQILKKQGSTPAYKDIATRALDRALMYGDDESVEVLLALGADIHSKPADVWLTPFQRAFKHKRDRFVSRMLDENCDCSGRLDWTNRTAAEVAIWKPRLDAERKRRELERN